MPNRDFSDVSPAAKGKVKSVGGSVSEDRGSFNEKQAFGGADLPGKTQPKDRSAGVKRAPVHPASKGL